MQRISAREAIPYDQWDQAKFDVLAYTLENVIRDVREAVAGRPVQQKTIFIGYEEIVGVEAPEGEAA